MNDIDARETDEARVQPRSSLPRSTVILLVVGAVVVIAASLLLYTQIGSDPDCSGEGPCVLYFYTED